MGPAKRPLLDASYVRRAGAPGDGDGGEHTPKGPPGCGYKSRDSSGTSLIPTNLSSTQNAGRVSRPLRKTSAHPNDPDMATTAPINLPKAKSVKTTPKRQKVTQPVAPTVEEPAAPPQATPMVVDATSETESSGVEGIHAKLLEIQKGQQKLQKSLNKTQKQANELRAYVFGEGEEDGTVGKKRKRQEPTGFAKPAYLSAALSDFLGLGRDTFMPRADVFKMLHDYIKNNQLQVQGNGRMLTVDAKISELLGIPEGKVTSFFSLQKYLVKHYGKAPFSEQAAAAGDEQDST